MRRTRIASGLLALLLLPPGGVLAEGAAPVAPLAILRKGQAEPVLGDASRFTGTVRIEARFGPDAPSRVYGATVTFQPKARTHWHSHPAGQLLVVTSGRGRVQRWGAAAQEIAAGDTVWIPPGAKHWHGGSPTSAMSHVAAVESVADSGVEWMEPVTDEQYTPTDEAAAPGASRAQQLLGAVAPKLADLTDEVLYGDVWERPQLSKRDRSLATIAALVAMNRPEQLRSHLRLGRKNGLTEAELAEVVTHLAFYAGWPSAVTAVRVMKETP